MSQRLLEAAVLAIGHLFEAEQLAAGARQRLLQAQAANPDAKTCSDAWHQALGASDAGFMHLGRQLELSGIELLAMAMAAAVETDPVVAQMVYQVQGGGGHHHVQVGLVLGLAKQCGLDGGHAALAELCHGAARRYGCLVLQEDAGRPLVLQLLRMPAALAMALIGQAMPWPGTRAAPTQPAWPRRVSDELDAEWQAAKAVAAGALVLRCGQEEEALSAVAGLGDLVQVCADPERIDWSGFAAYAMLQGVIPVLLLRPAPGDTARVPLVPGLQGPVLVIAGPEGDIWAAGGTVQWTLPRLHRKELREQWQELAGKDAAGLESWHVYGPSRLASLAKSARQAAAKAKRLSPDSEDIRKAVWRQEGHGLGHLAVPIKARIHDEALVVSKDLRSELQIVQERFKGRRELAEDLGTAIKERYREGVSALFHGPSGTGKTLAASWLATGLGIPLYRVDLAACMSKYIGETEKNLAELLARAEDDEIVLLFDEADALFSKRTDVRDSNDRYANAQTNYLLQRLESYKGLVILTTNSRTRLDSAFVRRLDHIIEFPTPGVGERKALWRSLLPHKHELSADDIARLAVLSDLAGGHIRNAVLRAALLARTARRLISLADVIEALAHEYRKLGTAMPSELQRLRR